MPTRKKPLALVGTVTELGALDSNPDSDEHGGRSLAPRPASQPGGVLARLENSAWLPLLGRGAAIVGGLLLFAGIGIYSTKAHPGGVHVASQLAPGAPVSWLAPTLALSAPEKSRANPGAPPSSASHDAAAIAGFAREPCSAPGTLCDKDKKSEPTPGVTEDGKVILNVAGPEVLTRLPGVGERRAEAIVQLRQRLKRFRQPSDLLRVRGIGVKSLKRMLPHLVLDPPAAAESEDQGKKEPAKTDVVK
jgi:competence protein ComEA